MRCKNEKCGKVLSFKVGQPYVTCECKEITACPEVVETVEVEAGVYEAELVVAQETPAPKPPKPAPVWPIDAEPAEVIFQPKKRGRKPKNQA